MFVRGDFALLFVFVVVLGDIDVIPASFVVVGTCVDDWGAIIGILGRWDAARGQGCNTSRGDLVVVGGGACGGSIVFAMSR